MFNKRCICLFKKKKNFKQKVEMILTGETQSTKRKFWAGGISSVTNPPCVMYWPGTESRAQQLRDLQLTA